MSGLAVRDKNGENVHYTGSQFEGLENVGTYHLCVRTGSGAEGVKKYGLTSAPLNDKYKGLRMRIPDNAGGNGGREAYIAQRYSVSESTSSSNAYTASRASNYVSSATLTTASKSSLNTKTTTRASTYTSSQTLSTASKSSLSTKTTTRASTSGTNYYGSLITSVSTNIVPSNYTVSMAGMFMAGSSSTNYNTSTLLTINDTRYSNGSFILYVMTYNQRLIYTMTRSSAATRTSGYTSSQTLTTASSSRLSTKTTTRASNYTSSQTLTTASSSELSTGNATRSSSYTTSSSMSTTSSKLTHNANL